MITTDAGADPRDAVRAAVPASHRDLLDRPLPGLLTTHLGSGRLQTSVIWYWTDGDDVLLSTMTEFVKARNLRARPRATLLVVGPDGRWVELRAEAREDPDPDPMASLDAVGVRYTGQAPYFGAVVAAELAEVEHPVTFRLVASAVVTGPRPPAPPAGRAPAPDDAGPDDAGPADGDAPTAGAASGATPGAASGAAPGESPGGTPGLLLPGLPLPASHLDLFDRPLLAALSTRLPDGAAQTQPVWCARDGDVLLVATTAERWKGRNLRADPRATVLIVDPANSSRWVEVRADAELVTDGAEALLDGLAREYAGVPAYYGHVAPASLRALETRVTVRLHARRIVCDAIHA